jgi:phospho-N-acetylmuramoyl-pentapeptide-transferase
MIIDIVKVFTPAAAAFFVGILITPILSYYLYKFKAWKKKPGKVDLNGGATPIFNELHKEKEVGTPRMGGIVIWLSAFLTITTIWLLSIIFPNPTTDKLDFLSRNQTWIPLFTLMAGALVGLIDDLYEIFGKTSHKAGGLSLTKRLVIVSTIALFVASWFFFKLEIVALGIPFFTLALYASGVIDGIDGLSGGVFAAIFAAYAGIAFYQQQIDLAAFSALMVGAILAFLWFNIPPARFYMSETGTMGLTITLAVVAFMTDSLGGGYGVFVLPVIAFPLVVTVLSVAIQVISKKFRNGKKVFLVAPIHHHFEAKGWPGPKVTMRFWVISIIFALIGMILALIG